MSYVFFRNVYGTVLKKEEFDELKSLSTNLFNKLGDDGLDECLAGVDKDSLTEFLDKYVRLSDDSTNGFLISYGLAMACLYLCSINPWFSVALLPSVALGYWLGNYLTKKEYEPYEELLNYLSE